MRLHLECSMGASGDMLMAALYELLPDKGAFRKKMRRLNLPGVTLDYSASTKCGITGTHISVRVDGVEEKSEDVKRGDGPSALRIPKRGKRGDGSSALRVEQKSLPLDSHHAFHFEEIIDLIHSLDLPDNVSDNAISVYNILGEAEAAVHGVSLNNVHLHEVGSLDAVADIVGCCLLMNMLGVTGITASQVHVGSGSVQCEHGILPVPAPATAEILKGVPVYGGRISGELCTPTGAALLKHFVSLFGEMPPMTVKKIGYGMGSKDFDTANCLRAFLCEDEAPDKGNRDTVYEISCNLDDMTPEAIGATFDVFFENGALDVYATSIMMKKNRPAVMLSCLCSEDKRDKLVVLMLEHTSTLGVRISVCRRDVLHRTVKTVPTEYGNIRVKHAHGFGVTRCKPEYDDVLTAAKQHSVPFITVYNEAVQAAERELQ